MGRMTSRIAEAAVLLLLATSGLAQENSSDAATGEATEEPTEEIVVVGSRAGDKRDLDHLYREALRKRVMRDLERYRAVQEEIAWREAGETEGPEPRIRLGYDPRRDDERSPVLDPNELPMDRTRPATIFRLGFGGRDRE